jgi:hypothetical protein
MDEEAKGEQLWAWANEIDGRVPGWEDETTDKIKEASDWAMSIINLDQLAKDADSNLEPAIKPPFYRDQFGNAFNVLAPIAPPPSPANLSLN